MSLFRGSPRLHSTTSSSRPSVVPSMTQVNQSQEGQQPGEEQPISLKPLNLLTATLSEIESLVKSLGHPKYRASQIHQSVRQRGITSPTEMTLIPKSLRESLLPLTTPGCLSLSPSLGAGELISQKDSTIKRAYACKDGQVIESVLMRYSSGRSTVCVSSQAGCAMGCVFCATGQMGFARQLTAEEIFEQVANYDCLIRGEGGDGVSNVVFMGMGEPLANYRNVLKAAGRINKELGIGARKITISTVGLAPNIRKLAEEDMQLGLAVSLHESTDEKRSALLPANRRYGGLDELMDSVKYYMEKTGRRVTFEWALIAGENDTPETARRLGKLFKSYGIRAGMCHINVIPLNPTDGFQGKKSGKDAVNIFCSVLGDEFGISATPRVRRGIDIDAGCGQLKSEIKKRMGGEPVGVADPTDAGDEDELDIVAGGDLESSVSNYAVDLDSDDNFDDMTMSKEEASAILNLVSGSAVPVEEPPKSTPRTTITSSDDVSRTERRLKKLKKTLKLIGKLEKSRDAGDKLLSAQLDKIQRRQEVEKEMEELRDNLKTS